MIVTEIHERTLERGFTLMLMVSPSVMPGHRPDVVIHVEEFPLKCFDVCAMMNDLF
ncbi:hypothetical protein LCGC14_2848050, partial [marine sediment metagenome]